MALPSASTLENSGDTILISGGCLTRRERSGRLGGNRGQSPISDATGSLCRKFRRCCRLTIRPPAANMVTMLVIARQLCLVDTQRERCTGTHTFRWRYSKDSSGSGGSDCIWVDHIEWIPTVTNFLADAVDSSLTYTTGGTWWYRQTSTYCYGGDAAQSGDDVDDSEESWMQTTVDVQTEGSLTFLWKVSSQSNSDWLEFYIDANRQDRISGTVDWQPKSYTITSAGSHTLKWRYVKDASGSAGSDCGWGVNGGSSCIRNHPFRGELGFRRHPPTFGLASELRGEETWIPAPDQALRGGRVSVAERIWTFISVGRVPGGTFRAGWGRRVARRLAGDALPLPAACAGSGSTGCRASAPPARRTRRCRSG